MDRFGQSPTAAEIEALARAALGRLPPAFAARLGDVVLCVTELADDDTLDRMEVDDPFALTGLYEGRPWGTEVATGDAPPVIHLYRRAILDEWADGEERLDHLVAHVLVHEAGHHFGLSDADIEGLERDAD